MHGLALSITRLIVHGLGGALGNTGWVPYAVAFTIMVLAWVPFFILT